MLPTMMPERGLIAHRGVAAAYPENTRAALLAAVEAGVPIVEYDVQRTLDGDPVVLHDPSLERTAGIRTDIGALTSAEALAVDVGYETRFGDRFHGTKLESLASIATALAPYPETVSLVELKPQSIEPRGAASFVEAAAPALLPLEGRVVIISFAESVLVAARRLGFPVGYCLDALSDGERARCEALSPELILFDQRQLADAPRPWPGPWRSGTWEVVEPERAVALFEAGIDYVESMAPDLLQDDARVRAALLG